MSTQDCTNSSSSMQDESNSEVMVISVSISSTVSIKQKYPSRACHIHTSMHRENDIRTIVIHYSCSITSLLGMQYLHMTNKNDNWQQHVTKWYKLHKHANIEKLHHLHVHKLHQNKSICSYSLYLSIEIFTAFKNTLQFIITESYTAA